MILSKQMLNDKVFVNNFVCKHLMQQIDNYNLPPFAVFNIRPVEIGCNSDDFIKNRVTVRVEFERYRVPRIFRKQADAKYKKVSLKIPG